MVPRGMFYVVGSGPTGVACARGLLDAGADVTLLDAGRRCEPAVMERVASLRAIPHAEWPSSAVAALKAPVFGEGSSLHALKLAYGSPFPYALDDGDLGAQHGTRCLQSLAQGGLSNVWGGAVLPYSAPDLQGWPLGLDALNPHFAAVARMLPIAGERDGLEDHFPFHAEPLPGATPSRQAQALESRLRRNRSPLAARGIAFGRSRLALRTRVTAAGEACQYVGLCLSGCPYLALYTAADTLEELRAHPRFRYVPGCKIEGVAEPRAGEVVLSGRWLDRGEAVRFTGVRAFLATGVISTAWIVLRSLRAYDHPLPLAYHPYFLLPLLALHNVAGVATERLHTLAQLFLEIRDPRISERWVHLQLYTYNELMRERLRAAMARLPAPSRWVERHLLGRLLAVQGYLHGGRADAIEICLRRGASESDDKLDLKGAMSPDHRRRIRRVAWKLVRSGPRLGAIAVPWMLHVGAPGEGNHIGSVFPMSAHPGPFETDLLGRLPAFRRVHLVDASVLPSLPATTLTYGSMANAHRIATAAVRLEAGPS